MPEVLDKSTALLAMLSPVECDFVENLSSVAPEYRYDLSGSRNSVAAGDWVRIRHYRRKDDQRVGQNLVGPNELKLSALETQISLAPEGMHEYSTNCSASRNNDPAGSGVSSVRGGVLEACRRCQSLNHFDDGQ